jgi:sulfopropanediol 3-dehydrogenase
MTVEYIKKSINQKQRSEDDEKVKKVVEETLKKIELEGDKCIRELS